MTQDIKTRIREIIAEQAMLDPEQITDEATPADLGIDSLGLVESIFAIEEAFDISIPFNANDPEASEFDISDMGKIIAAVEKLVAEKA
ncbi:MAG: phosphopantetheine-binding protein [Paracoccus sp. (in: a-proteobacteria)]|uniref:acyl carrier protein n=1 Tax=Paracoccus sp. TaxID=267 RepID=UPI0026E113A4|nr:phosphopantetheine-binding protein [Paracoccus sp. (in: a-proteobacteria)]MDO5622175.1 phosphopantetheine-binding protein [Paracoccus sp. (in: a-proteobacteria)]